MDMHMDDHVCANREADAERDDSLRPKEITWLMSTAAILSCAETASVIWVTP
jgi:hypothetical protein